MSMDQREVTLLVLLDLNAVFDTVSDYVRNIKIKFWGHRKQFVSVNQVLSSSFPMITGVPQGSCLGSGVK